MCGDMQVTEPEPLTPVGLELRNLCPHHHHYTHTNSLTEVGGQGKWAFVDSEPQVSGSGAVPFNSSVRTAPHTLKNSGFLALDTWEEEERLGEKT